MRRGVNGKLAKKYVRKPYYECDLNPEGGGKLTQTKLPFYKKTPDDRKLRRGGADDNFTRGLDIATPSVGQIFGCADDRNENTEAGINE